MASLDLVNPAKTRTLKQGSGKRAGAFPFPFYKAVLESETVFLKPKSAVFTVPASCTAADRDFPAHQAPSVDRRQNPCVRKTLWRMDSVR